MNAPPWRKGRIIRIEKEAYETDRFWISIPELDKFEFIPGQHITLELPISEKVSKRLSFSISSWPDGTNTFELIIVHNKDEAAANFLFNELKEGDEIKVKGPQGRFTMPAVLDKELFFICTGTGIAPFRSMLHYIIRNNKPHKNIYLISGTRTREHLLYHEEMKALSEDLPLFHYMPVLSREEWAGEKGYVHQVYKRLAKSGQPAYFYLCGWKKMIEEAEKHILDLGYDKKDIHHEMYG